MEPPMSLLHPTRRHALLFVAAGAGALAAPRLASARPATEDPFAALERRMGGRLGAALLQGERFAGRRAEERFALCSSFKLPLAALALREAEQGRLDFGESLGFGEADLIGWAPVARARLAQGTMTVGQAAEAAQVHSDNTAANLLLRRLGGHVRYNAFLRELGDSTTRLDGMEPAVGFAAADGVGNTSTPLAMARTALALVQGAALRPESRAVLLGWMRATSTGPRRLKAGLPAAWGFAHKTGTQAEADAPNLCIDIGVAFPASRPPLAIAAFYEAPVRNAPIRPQDEAALAEVGRIAAHWAQG